MHSFTAAPLTQSIGTRIQITARVVVAAFSIALWTGTVSGQVVTNGSGVTDSPTSCGHEDTLRHMARRIVTTRSSLSRSTSARYGADAAYLLMHYDQLSTADSIALIDQLKTEGDPAPGVDSLMAAFVTARSLVTPDSLFDNTQLRDLLLRGDQHLIRAVIMLDEGASFFATLKKIRSQPDLAAKQVKLFWLPAIIMDRSEAFRIQVAEQAIAASEYAIAARIFASLTDLSRYRELLETRKDDPEFVRDAGTNTVIRYGITLQNHRDILSADFGGKVLMHPDEYQVYRAAYLTPQAGFLGMALNQVGGLHDFSSVAQTYITAFESGDIVPHDDIEAHWLTIYDAMFTIMGRDATHRALDGFEFSNRHRHFSGRALQLLEWAFAKRELSAFLNGEASEPPDKPVQLTDAFDWQLWVDTVTLVRAGKTEYSNESQRRIAVEMYAILDDYAKVEEVIALNFTPEERIQIYRDFMQRLDRRCKQLTDFPGQANLLGGTILYRFQP